MAGSAAFLTDVSAPCRSSSLISSPTRKKKTPMRPSLTQARALSAWPPMAGPKGDSQRPHHHADAGPFARDRLTAVAPRSAAAPKPFSWSSLSVRVMPAKGPSGSPQFVGWAMSHSSAFGTFAGS